MELKNKIYDKLKKKWEVGFNQEDLEFALKSFKDCHTRYRYPHQHVRYTGKHNEFGISTFTFIQIELNVMLECSLKHIEEWFVENVYGENKKGKK